MLLAVFSLNMICLHYVKYRIPSSYACTESRLCVSVRAKLLEAYVIVMVNETGLHSVLLCSLIRNPVSQERKDRLQFPMIVSQPFINID